MSLFSFLLLVICTHPLLVDSISIALCSYPLVKMEIGDSSQISTTAPIFLLSNYFRQKYLQIASYAVSLLNNIWVRVEHSLLQQLNLQKVNCNSSSLQAGCELYFGDELNTSLKTASNILYDGKNDEKYLYISDPIFTMLLAPEKKVILDFFSEHKVICLCAEFEVYPTPATGFFDNDCLILDKYVIGIFFLQILSSFSPVSAGIIIF